MCVKKRLLAAYQKTRNRFTFASYKVGIFVSVHVIMQVRNAGIRRGVTCAGDMHISNKGMCDKAQMVLAQGASDWYYVFEHCVHY